MLNITTMLNIKCITKKRIVIVFLIILIAFQCHNMQKNSIENEINECRKFFTTIHDPLKNGTTSMKNFIPSSVEEILHYKPPTIPKTFLIEQENYCHKRPQLRIICYVHSRIDATKNRQETRDTWGSYSPTIGVVFMVGRSKSKEEEDIVQRESNLYHDIVQGNYTDLYELLVYKALNALYWINKNCHMVPWVLHSDDDTIIDVKMLTQMLDAYELENYENYVFCRVYRNAKTRRSGKWAINATHYACKYYPPYCAGPCWFTSIKGSKGLLNTVPKVNFLWIDDVYLTGFVLENSGLKWFDLPMLDNNPMEKSQIGSYVAWLNTKSNQTEAWKHIKDYYSKAN